MPHYLLTTVNFHFFVKWTAWVQCVDTPHNQLLWAKLQEQNTKYYQSPKSTLRRERPITCITAVPLFRRLCTRMSPQRPRFSPRPMHVASVAEKLDLGQVFLRVLRSSPTHSFNSPTLYDTSKRQRLKTLHLIKI